MANNKFHFDGLDEYRAQLRKLPLQFRDEAAAVVHQAARDAMQQIKDAYPDKTGHLQAGMGVAFQISGDRPSGTPGKGVQFGASAVVKNRAKHAWLWEHGSVARHVDVLPDFPAANFGYARGAMPAHPTFIPIMIRRRKQMQRGLMAILQRAGLQVTGDGG